ncbi:PREDICTED: protein NipSnap homolog 1-like [Amphimedon queenslandica]|uniref:NIPSNAP domain-containing protein n=1 Tax=Amphimedon queenslandica TaxID=400682 RepID=A0A1X7U5S0_AMPQE|nr:PREDICTED: protein NipSnap homolog 1-like [Amphimedon queenslandica]|eukprot:XP_003388978.1 PREDICTED: protein NipSnap homolog 1-like [Amphimedon queenslandica]
MAALSRYGRLLFAGSKRVLSRSFFGSSREGGKGSQSKVLGGTSAPVYELQVHNVKPEHMKDYLSLTEDQYTRLNSSSSIPVDLIGSWTVQVGLNVDQTLHLWRYKDGYETMDKVWTCLKEDKEWQDYSHNKLANQIYSRSSQVLVAFTFWDPAGLESETKRGLYEMRTYTLKAGTTIEWGHEWRQGLKFRDKREAVGGWFSQIGEMHVVHHLWGYENLVDRRDTRQQAWQEPGWDQCVRETVPLIRHMEARILRPNSFSPLQ